MSYQFIKETSKRADIRAFIAMIGKSEGASYDSLFGDGAGGIARKFSDFTTHPAQNNNVPKSEITFNHGQHSTAAGVGQILLGTFLDIERKYGANYPWGKMDYTPETQDLCITELLNECNAIHLVTSGDIAAAIAACAHIWASFPGAGYDQHENALNGLLSIYNSELANTTA